MKKAALAVLLAAVLGTSAAAIAWAAGDDSAVIHACVAKGSNLVRIPSAGDGCRPNESGLDWNTQGPVGPPGPQGPAGPSGSTAPEPNTRDVAFMHVDGGTLGTIEGEATERGHEKWITISGYDGDTTVPVSTGGGGSTGRVQFKPIVVTKPIDKSTPKLFQALVTGRHLPAVQIDFVRPDGAGGDEVFYSVKLEQVIVTDVHQSDAGTSSGRPLEQVSLDFQKIEITYGGSTASGGGPAG